MNAILLAELAAKAKELSEKHKSTIILAFEVWHHLECGPSSKSRVHAIRDGVSIASFDAETIEEIEAILIEITSDDGLLKQVLELEERARKLRERMAT